MKHFAWLFMGLVCVALVSMLAVTGCQSNPGKDDDDKLKKKSYQYNQPDYNRHSRGGGYY